MFFSKLFLALLGFCLGGVFPVFVSSLPLVALCKFTPFVTALVLAACDQLVRARLNAFVQIFKSGFLFGIFVDAFKVGS